jgi:hypothetical protein
MGSSIDRETFLARARARFGQHYDYSGIVYKSYKTPIQIRCTVHPVKVIAITPEKHLSTTGGCKFCLRAVRRARRGLDDIPPEIVRVQPPDASAASRLREAGLLHTLRGGVLPDSVLFP